VIGWFLHGAPRRKRIEACRRALRGVVADRGIRPRP